jgi:hypothetical protein
MNNIINCFQIISESDKFESDYLPMIAFKTLQQKDLAEKYILTKVDIFFREIIQININIEASQLPYAKIITEKDFTKKRASYFYENILFDLNERDGDGKLIIKHKWGITFDEKCAPIKVSWLSPKFIPGYKKPNLKLFEHDQLHCYFKYGTIDINKNPVFYYIYFSLQEILDVINSRSIQPSNLVFDE